MKRAGKLALLLFALTLTTVLGGCQDKKESGKEFANNESSTETKDRDCHRFSGDQQVQRLHKSGTNHGRFHCSRNYLGP